MTNGEKRNKYATLMSKLNKATNNEYYYEAIFIEYAIIEERTRAVFKHSRIPDFASNGREYTLDRKLKMIKSNKAFQDTYIKKHLTEELINNIINWKNERNKIMHDIIKTNYENEVIKNLALQGECFARRINNKSKLVNNYLDKKISRNN